MSLKHFILALVACVALSQTGLRSAHAQPAYEVTLEDEWGNTLQRFQHRGQVFAMGRMGQRYNLRVTNHTTRRVEAVVTVDGRDVLSGRPGDYKAQRGYLVPAYGSVLIDGFRTSLSEVAAFRFTTPHDSYSSRMGTPENVGVIGTAFFSEAPPPRSVYRYRSARPYDNEGRKQGSWDGPGSGAGGSRNAPAAEESPSAPSASLQSRSYRDEDDAENNIGTQYGEQKESQVTEVEFARAHPTHPDHVLVVRYDNREGLERRGIRTWPRPLPRAYLQPRGPSAFPVNRFAPPPPPYHYN